MYNITAAGGNGRQK